MRVLLNCYPYYYSDFNDSSSRFLHSFRLCSGLEVVSETFFRMNLRCASYVCSYIRFFFDF